MQFFKKNSYEIVRLYIYQIGITIFSLALYTAVGTIENNSAFLYTKIGVSLFAYGFYLVLVYYGLWELGAKDKIRIDGGRATAEPYKGLKMAVFSNLPNMILGLLSVIWVSIFLVSSAEWTKTVFSVFYLIMRFHNSIFLGLITGITPTIEDVKSTAYFYDCLLESAIYMLIPLLSVLFAHFAYTMGSKEKKIFSKK